MKIQKNFYNLKDINSINKTDLSIDLTKCHKIWKTSMHGLTTKEKKENDNLLLKKYQNYGYTDMTSIFFSSLVSIKNETDTDWIYSYAELESFIRIHLSLDKTQTNLEKFYLSRIWWIKIVPNSDKFSIRICFILDGYRQMRMKKKSGSRVSEPNYVLHNMQYCFLYWDDWADAWVGLAVTSYVLTLTFLNVSREHTIFPKPRMFGVCWVCAKNIKYIRCILIDSKCQSCWQSLSLKISNWALTLSPISQMIKSIANMPVTTFDVDTNSARFQISCDFFPENWIATK